MLAARAAFARRPRETLEDGELLRKNISMWGDPGTGKSFWCNQLAG
jgi:predicted ATPase with chaperone activity